MADTNPDFIDFDAPMTEREMMDALLKELRSLAFSDIAGMYDENNCLKDIADIDPALRKAIAGIETKEIFSGTGMAREKIGETKYVKLWAKDKSIENFMKHLGMFIERIEVKKDIQITVKQVDLDERVEQLKKSRMNGVN